MTQTTPIKIGFLGSSAPSSPHHASFKKFIPRDIDFSFVQESGEKTSLYDAQGKVDALIEQSRQLIEANGWRGLIISGAPKEALNPGMWEQVSKALSIPVTLALRSSVAALKAFSARKILLMTPVDDRLKKMYYDYLAGFGIESFYPPQILRAHTDAQKLTSSDVRVDDQNRTGGISQRRRHLLPRRPARSDPDSRQAGNGVANADRCQQSGDALVGPVQARLELPY